MMTSAIVASLLLSLGVSVVLADTSPKRADDTRASGTAQDRCLKQLEKSEGKYTFKFVKSESALGYEVLEIPKEQKEGSYVTYYSEDGYAEINSKGLACNSNKQKKDKAKDVKAKLLNIFQQREKEAIQTQKDLEQLMIDKKLTDGSGGHISGLATFRDVCAQAFPAIKEYLVSKGTLPKNDKAPAITNCMDPNSPITCEELANQKTR